MTLYYKLTIWNRDANEEHIVYFKELIHLHLYIKRYEEGENVELKNEDYKIEDYYCDDVNLINTDD